MPSSPRRRRSGHGEVIPPLLVSDRIDLLLKEQLSIFTTKPELTEAEIEHWHRDLGGYPITAIEFAFDNWRRNGHFFPVYADVIQLCESFLPPQQRVNKCAPECEAQHGRGYGWNDMLKLWEMHDAKREEVGRKLTAEEWDVLLDLLDGKRGQSPAWRSA